MSFLSKAEDSSIVCVHHMLFNTFVNQGHLGYLDRLAPTDHAFTKTVFKYLFETVLSILLDVYSEVESLDHLVILLLMLF